ncbi:InlB B-repeat-containing protein [Actinotignum sp. GS-2025c]|uniref:InlB B-repeat-containing protein n=1 Tax=Actinotignum sp. GS-2025c TaxID=3427276 RepID=UPI003F4528D3
MLTRNLSRVLAVIAAIAMVVVGQPLRAEAAPQSVDFNYVIGEKIQKFEFTAHNPDNPSESITYPSDPAKRYNYKRIPAGWVLNGQIVMQPGWKITSTGSDLLYPDNLEQSVTGIGKDAVLTYHVKDAKPTENIYFQQISYEQFNYATYDLNGGTWTDKIPTDPLHQAQDGSFYSMFITPLGTVQKPTDPVREGYTFLGWIGKSSLNIPAVEPPYKYNVYTVDNPYRFDEIDPNRLLGYRRQNVVNLTAAWAKEPALEVKNIEIWEGEAFTPSDMVVSATDFAGKDLTDPANGGSVTPVGDYDNAVAGEYPITFTAKDSKGGTVTRTAKLIVKKRWTPLIPAPELTLKNVEIQAGEPFDPADMVVSSSGTAVPSPDNVYDPKTPGTYTLTFTVTNEQGVKRTATAQLVVKQPWAIIEAAPELSLKDVTITVGDPFDPADMVVSSSGTAVPSPDNAYDPNTPGTYDLSFTVTDEKGATVTRTAKLTVKPKPEPAPEPAPEPGTETPEPGEPGTPGQPGNPGQPGDPGQPGQASGTTPSTPETPGTPGEPSQPGTTGATATPGKQGTVAKAGSRSLAHTGSDAAAPFALGGMLVLAGGALVATRRKNS